MYSPVCCLYAYNDHEKPFYHRIQDKLTLSLPDTLKNFHDYPYLAS